MYYLAAVEHHAQKSRTAGDAVSHATRNIGHLSGVEFHGAPFGMIERVAAELKPDFILVAAPVEAVLLLLEIVHVNTELFGIV